MHMKTDGGANVVKVIALNNWTRLSCFGHHLHIAIAKFNLPLKKTEEIKMQLL